VKAAMNMAGYKGGIPRRPLLPLTPRETSALRAALEAEGLV
jgi:dihydrodipicolinate synthase/N-acetylneuraminate lyase